MNSKREVVANWEDLDKEVVREGLRRSDSARATSSS